MPPAPREATLRAAIVLVTLMLCAFFIARGASALIARALLERTVPQGQRLLDEPFGSEQAAAAPDPRELLARNAFDPRTGALWPPQPPGPRAKTTYPDATAAACESGLRLVATVQVESRREQSLASLASGTDRAHLYREGASFGKAALVSIAVDSVTLRRDDGCLCSLALFGAAAVAEVTSVPASPFANPEVQSVSENEYAISRTFVEHTLAHPQAALGMVRTVPHERSGNLVGFKLYGVRRDHLAQQLGLQNGDLLRSVSGFELTSPDAALEAYAKLRDADEVTLVIERRGRPLRLRYVVQ